LFFFYKFYSEDRFFTIVLSSALKIFECVRYCSRWRHRS